MGRLQPDLVPIMAKSILVVGSNPKPKNSVNDVTDKMMQVAVTAQSSEIAKTSSPREPSTATKRGSFQSLAASHRQRRYLIHPISQINNLTVKRQKVIPATPNSKSAANSAASLQHQLVTSIQHDIQSLNNANHEPVVECLQLTADDPAILVQADPISLPWEMAKKLHHESIADVIAAHDDAHCVDNNDALSDEEKRRNDIYTAGNDDDDDDINEKAPKYTYCKKSETKRIHHANRKYKVQRRVDRDPQRNQADDKKSIKRSDPALVEEWLQIMVSRGLERNRDRILCTFGLETNEDAKSHLINQVNEQNKLLVINDDVDDNDNDHDNKRCCEMDQGILTTEPLQQQLGIDGTQMRPLNVIEMDRSCLSNMGLSRELVNRMYRCLYVYTAGLQELMDDFGCTTNKNINITGIGSASRKVKNDSISMRFWKLFQILNEECQGPNSQYTSGLADMTVRHQNQINELALCFGNQITEMNITIEAAHVETRETRVERDKATEDTKILKRNCEVLERQRQDAEHSFETVNDELVRIRVELKNNKEELMQSQLNTQLKEEEVTYLNNRVAALQTAHAERLKTQVGETHAVRDVLLTAQLNVKELEDAVRLAQTTNVELQANAQELRNANTTCRKEVQNVKLEVNKHQVRASRAETALDQCMEKLRAIRECADIGQEEVRAVRVLYGDLQRHVSESLVIHAAAAERIRLSEERYRQMENIFKKTRNALESSKHQCQLYIGQNKALDTAVRSWRDKARQAQTQCESIRVPFQELVVKNKETEKRLLAESISRIECQTKLNNARKKIQISKQQILAIEEETVRLKEEVEHAALTSTKHVYESRESISMLKEEVMGLVQSETNLKHHMSELSDEVRKKSKHVRRLSRTAARGRNSITELRGHVFAMEDASNDVLKQTAALHALCNRVFQRIADLAVQYAGDVNDTHKISLEQAIKQMNETAPSMTMADLEVLPVSSTSISASTSPAVPRRSIASLSSAEDLTLVDHGLVDKQINTEKDKSVNMHGAYDDDDQSDTDSDDSNSNSETNRNKKMNRKTRTQSRMSTSTIDPPPLPQMPDIKAYVARLPMLDFVARNLTGLRSTAEKEKRLCARANVLLAQAREQMGMMAEDQLTRELRLRHELVEQRCRTIQSVDASAKVDSDVTGVGSNTLRKVGGDMNTGTTALKATNDGKPSNAGASNKQPPPQHEYRMSRVERRANTRRSTVFDSMLVAIPTLANGSLDEAAMKKQQQQLQNMVEHMRKLNTSMEEELHLAKGRARRAFDLNVDDEKRYKAAMIQISNATQTVTELRENVKELEDKHDAAMAETAQYKKKNEALSLRVMHLERGGNELEESVLEMDTRVLKLAKEVGRLGQVKVELIDGAADALTAIECNDFMLALTTLKETMRVHGDGFAGKIPKK